MRIKAFILGFLILALGCSNMPVRYSQNKGDVELWADIPSVKKVALTYNIMHAGDWLNKTFREIIKSRSIRRIIRSKEMGFTNHRNNTDENYNEIIQKDYNDFVAHLPTSEEKARTMGCLALERAVAEIIFICKDGQVYIVEVFCDTSDFINRKITAVAVWGDGKSVRIPVKDYSLPGVKQKTVKEK